MSLVAPLGPVYQAGTLSGNPLAVSAGLATLEELTPREYERLDALSGTLAEGLRNAIVKTRKRAVVQSVGSMLTLFFHDGPVANWNDAKASDTKQFASFHRALTESGVYWPPSQFEAAFVSLAHTRDDIEKTIAAAEAALGSF
jgi:glutamate-1-semialdehyde 2,1-aminomutase